jgi:predicted porin
MALLLLAPVVQASDSGDVTLYGQMRISADNTDNDQDETARVSNGESRMGVRGAENLGNGMKTVFQLEVKSTWTTAWAAAAVRLQHLSMGRIYPAFPWV